MVKKGHKKAKKAPKKRKIEKKRQLSPEKKKEEYHKTIANLEQLMEKIKGYKHVDTQKIENETKKIKLRQLIKFPKKLSNLNQLEKKTLSIHKKLKTKKKTPVPHTEMKKIKHIATEIKKHRIITDFDRVMFYVNAKKKASINNIAKGLFIDQKRVEECAKILEEEGLIEIDYPIIGNLLLEEKDYKKKLKADKAKKKN